MATSAFSLRTPLRQARLAQLLVLVWMLLEAAVAIGSGIAARSIALTAFARSEDRTEALLAGYSVHVPKPVETSELIAAVASLCGKTARPALAAQARRLGTVRSHRLHPAVERSFSPPGRAT